MPRGRRKKPAPSRPIAPIILAAGASRRLGECKALVDLDGRTPLEILVHGAQGLGSSKPLVIAGAHAKVLAEKLPKGCELIVNPNWEAGRTGGLVLAAKARPGLDLAIIPVDVPRVPRQVFQDLAAAWAAQGAPAMGWLAPRFQGRFGHPIVLGRDLARRLARFGPDTPLSDLRAAADPLLALETDCPEVLEDLDTPLDLERLRRPGDTGDTGDHGNPGT